jgi:uncharacterized RDD family membrane protein YckC
VEHDEYAGLVSRSGALGIDVLVLILGSLAVGGLPGLAWEKIIDPKVPPFLDSVAHFLAFILPLVYFTTFWWLTGQTIGDMVTGTIVVRVDGGDIGFLHAAIRAAGGLLLAPLWLVGLLSILWDRRRMAWHDHVFRTTVQYAAAHKRAGHVTH